MRDLYESQSEYRANLDRFESEAGSMMGYSINSKVYKPNKQKSGVLQMTAHQKRITNNRTFFKNNDVSIYKLGSQGTIRPTHVIQDSYKSESELIDEVYRIEYEDEQDQGHDYKHL